MISVYLLLDCALPLLLFAHTNPDFFAHTDPTDLTGLLCGCGISRRLGEWVWGVVRLLRVLCVL